MWKFVLFLLLACALTFAVAWVPGVDRLLGSVACTPDETYAWRQTSAGTTESWSWVCVDREGRFSVSESSVRPGELAAFGLLFATSCVLAAIPFAVVWLLRRRRT